MKIITRSCGLLALLTFTASAATGSAAASYLKTDALYLAGGFQGIDGSSLTLSRDQLRAIPGSKTISAALIPRIDPAELSVLPFTALIKAYPLKAGFDGLVLETHNGWESFLTREYIETNATVLLLRYAGKSPAEEMWPMFGGNIEPLAPFYAFDPGDPIPRFTTAPKYGMIAATQIKGIRAVNTQERYATTFATMHSPIGQQGRDLFLQRCNGCHLGPGGVGGNVALRPFEVLQGHANYNQDYFKSMVVDPDQFFPGTAMPGNPDFELADLDALITFLQEATP